MKRDLIFGGAALVLAVAYYLLADAIPTSMLADAVGPGGLPKAYAVVLGALSLILLAQAMIRRYAAVRAAGRAGGQMGSEADGPPVRRVHLYRAAGMLAIGAVYVILTPWLGYILTLATLIAVTTYYQGGGLSARVGIVALGGALFYWLLFVWLLRIPQPPGLWPELF